MTLSEPEKKLLLAMLGRRSNKERWRQLMVRRDRFADRLSGETGPYLGRMRVMIFQSLMMLAEDASPEQRAEWEVVAQRESIKAARRHLRDFIGNVDG